MIGHNLEYGDFGINIIKIPKITQNDIQLCELLEKLDEMSDVIYHLQKSARSKKSYGSCPAS